MQLCCKYLQALKGLLHIAYNALGVFMDRLLHQVQQLGAVLHENRVKFFYLLHNTKTTVARVQDTIA